ncbi:MAG: hypothetical protein ACI9U2_000233 [Bradymonadia bacterium]
MRFEVQNANGDVLYTQDQLEQALACQSARRILPRWMQSLVWPHGMLHAMRIARRSKNHRTLSAILLEARMLSDAEHAGLTTAAAAIRHQLREKYDSPPAAFITTDPCVLGVDPAGDSAATG